MPRRGTLVFTAACLVTFASACAESTAPGPRAPTGLADPARALQGEAPPGPRIDPWSPPPPSAFEQRSAAEAVGGVILAGLGLGGLGFGTTAYAIATRSCAEINNNFESPLDRSSIASSARIDCSSTGAQAGAMAAMLAGAALVAVGVPLWVHGATKVPKRGGSGAAARAEVLVTSGSAGVRWSF